MKKQNRKGVQKEVPWLEKQRQAMPPAKPDTKEKVRKVCVVECSHAAFNAFSCFLHRKVWEIITMQNAPEGTLATANAMIHTFTHKEQMISLVKGLIWKLL